jgi:hypothetical protein
VTATLLCAAAIMGVGLVVAVAELVRRRSRAELPPPSHRPELHLHNM